MELLLSKLSTKTLTQFFLDCVVASVFAPHPTTRFSLVSLCLWASVFAPHPTTHFSLVHCVADSVFAPTSCHTF